MTEQGLDDLEFANKANIEAARKFKAERDALVEALQDIARCSVAGYSLNGRETHSDLAEIISYLNSQLQRRVKAAEEALTHHMEQERSES